MSLSIRSLWFYFKPVRKRPKGFTAHLICSEQRVCNGAYAQRMKELGKLRCLLVHRETELLRYLDTKVSLPLAKAATITYPTPFLLPPFLYPTPFLV